MKNEKVDYEIIDDVEVNAWEIHIPYMEDITVEEMRKALTDALELLKGAEEAFIVAEASANCLPESNNYKGYDILLVKQGDCDIRNCKLCFSKNVQDNNSDIVQIKNPKSGRYIKIDKSVGKIISYKKSEGAYKDILIVGNRKNEIRQ